MDREIHQRLQWVKLYEKHGNAGFVCRRCGISRPTLRKWWARYQELGIAGLESKSRRPHNSPATKVGSYEESLILELRQTRNLGARRIQSELRRNNSVSLSLGTIHKTLKRHHVPPIRKFVNLHPKLSKRCINDVLFNQYLIYYDIEQVLNLIQNYEQSPSTLEPIPVNKNLL